MNTSSFVGAVLGSIVLVSGVILFLKKHLKNDKLTTSVSALFKNHSFENIVEVDNLSLRTYGTWMKTLDIPKFDSCHFFVIKVSISKLPNNYSSQTEKYGDIAYAFVVTDDKRSKVIASQVTLATKLDSKFENIMTRDVIEIKL